MNKLKELFKKENIIKGLKWFFFSYIWLGVLLFVIDIVSKHVALNAFGGWDTFYEGVPSDAYGSFIPGVMSFTLTFNTGAAWGILGNVEDIYRRIILIGISAILSIAFIVFYIVKFKKLNRWYKAFLMCLAAGAIGNLIDRAAYPDGKVIDFIQFDFWPTFPVFNFADAVLVVAIAFMVVYMAIEEIMAFIKKRKLEKETENLPNDSSLNDNIESENKVEENKEENKKDE